MKFNLKLTHKIMLMVFAVLVISITGLGLISTIKSSDYLTDTAKADLAHMTTMTKGMCRLAAEDSRIKVKGDLETARLAFERIGGSQVIMENGQMILDPHGAHRVIDNNTEFVDDITKRTGSYCTIFNNEGTQARRIATSVLKKDGNRATGTIVSQEVFDTVIRNKQTFWGRAWVVDQYYVTAYEPIYDVNGEVAGILFVGTKEMSASLREQVLSMKVGKTGYIYAMDRKGILQIHPKSEGNDIGNNGFAREMIEKAPRLSDSEIGWVNYEWDRNGTMAEKIVAYVYFEDWDWIIGVGSYLDEFTAPANNIQRAIIIFGIVCLLVSLVIAFLLARTIIRPITGLVDVAEAVAVGDISKEIVVKSRDEVGVLALSIKNLIEYIREIARASEKIAGNDLTATVEPRSDKDVLGNSFKTMITNLGGIIRQLRDNATELVSAANEISSASEEMATGAKSQTDQTAQVSSAVEEMTATIVESAKNANEAKEASEAASQGSDEGQKIVGDTISGMVKIAESAQDSGKIVGELAKASDKIGEIIGVIDDIADQTNLLALNAAIEAARAGEQGRGFAVVADEVRKLAERTGKATGEITEMIKGIQNDSNRAVASMDEAGKLVEEGKGMADKAGNSLNEINTVAQRVTDMIVQIATASDQQSAAAEQISKNMENISNVTKETATGAEQSASAAEELNRQAEGLKQMVGQFKIKENA